MNAATPPTPGTATPRPRSWWLTRPVRWSILLAVLGALGFAVNPLRVRYHLIAGQDRLRNEEYDAARFHFERARRLRPDEPETQFWMARLSRKTGDLEAVRRYLDRAQALGYEEPQRLRNEWWMLLAETGRMREAAPHLAEMLVNAGPDGAEICNAFVRGYCLSLQFDEALTLVRAWQSDYPDDARAYALEGEIHAGNQRWTQAAAAFRQALTHQPDDPESQTGLAEALIELHRPEEALGVLRRTVVTTPDHVPALMILAQLTLQDKDFAAARGYAERAVAAEPANDEAQLLLANIELASGDAPACIERLEPILSLWPGDLQARYCLAQALRRLGRQEEAEQHLQIYAELERIRARLEELDREVRRHPDDPELRYELGKLLLHHESRSEGVVWLQSVFQFSPLHAGAHQELAEYYSKLGDETLAQQHRAFIEPAAAESPRS